MKLLQLTRIAPVGGPIWFNPAQVSHIMDSSSGGTTIVLAGNPHAAFVTEDVFEVARQLEEALNVLHP